MNKNTLYITFDGLSDPLGQSQILPYLSGIAANGFHIHILSCEKKERLNKEKETILSLIGNLPISWDYILYDEEGGVISRLRYIRRINRMADKIRKEKEIRLVHCRSYLASLTGLSFKLRYKIPFIFDMRGFWADERIDGGIWKKSKVLENFFYTYFKKKEKQFVLRSDAIVSLTNSAVKELSTRFPTELIARKTTVIPCCTNTELFSKQAVKLTIEVPTFSSADHLLIYTGSIGTWYYTREMIDCVLAWKEFIPEIKLLILTKDLEALANILTSYSAEQKKIVISASCSHRDVAAYLSLAKAAIFFIKPSYSKIASSPTKMAECWAMDLPIITNPGIGDNDFYFTTHEGGILVDDFTNADYQSACQKYITLGRKENAYREIALRYFDTQMAIEKYTGIYKSLIPCAC